MNVIIPPKRGDKGSSFNRLVSYISDRMDKPNDDDEISSTARASASRSKKAMFDRLVDYVERNEGDDRAVVITDVFPDGRQRLISGGISCETNCFSWETAAAEMNMVAAQSTRCQDPVYHFILSWRENEAPTDAQIFECAEYSIRQLGMEGHQYVTAVHQDTDNTHCHVAVNRVNPVTYKAANLWNDADTLQKACRVLERKYGFIQDNGSWEWGVNDQLKRAPLRFTRAPRDAVPLQVYSNTESLYHYAVENVRDGISKMLEDNSLTWEKTHRVLHDRGLGLREQGDGLVVYDYLRPESPTVVKASSVHVALTKGKLERHIGKYEGRPSFATEAFDDSQSYVLMRSNYQPQFELRDKDARFERRQARAEARLDLKLRYQRYRDGFKRPELNVLGRQREIADHFRAMKATVRDKHRDPVMRKLMYRVAEFERMKAMAELRIQVRKERQDLADKGLGRPMGYRAWVEQEALAGDVAAVSQLRGMAYREKRQAKRNERDVDRVILCGVADDSPVHDWKTHATQVRRNGVVEYVRDGVVGVRDEGTLVHINPGYFGGEDRSNFALAMAITSHKSGDRVAFQGEIPFMQDALRSLQDFNREYGLSRFEPTREDQQRYLDYLEEVDRSQPQVDRQAATAHVPPDPAPIQYPRP
ncbi:TraI/MobA(P) family conjugative relaxase [Pseudomonas coleopterorum]|uniref:TraI/MobA(P) family conjugative relaxase n=1 Tax=Pseudomonas coleopterorum TaxID=1605838 RepID=UPI00089B8A8E|nr:TraI/MobA(P) family conjugative relaxase [Pseudomonas coleopterorum]SEE90750.1 Relaxase/Mobilisation nuclease domain-containing protein [Pseudomonas coleopterorum]